MNKHQADYEMIHARNSAGESVTKVAKELGVPQAGFYMWRKKIGLVKPKGALGRRGKGTEKEPLFIDASKVATRTYTKKADADESPIVALMFKNKRELIRFMGEKS